MPSSPPRRRRWTLALVLAAQVLGWGAVGAEPTLPLERQVALMVATAGSDRNLAARAGGKVNVLVVSKGQDGPGRRVVSTVLAALAVRRGIAGMPHQDTTVTFSSAAALADVIRSQRIALVFLTPSVDGEVTAIGRALDGVSVLTVGSAEVVGRGAVIGFDLVSGRPQMVVNLQQARRQKVDFEELLLERAKVVP